PVAATLSSYTPALSVQRKQPGRPRRAAPSHAYALSFLAGRLRLPVRDDLRLDDLLRHRLRLQGRPRGHGCSVLGGDRGGAGRARRDRYVVEARPDVRPGAGVAGRSAGGEGAD